MSRHRRSGFSDGVRRSIYERASFRCERCRSSRGPFHIHHRLPRRMGGSRDPRVDSVENGVLLCVLCHAWVESNRTRALADGWLLQQVADIGKVWPVHDADAEAEGAGEAVDDGSSPALGTGLLNGSPVLLGEHVDEGLLQVSDVSEPDDRIGDGVEVRGEGGYQ